MAHDEAHDPRDGSTDTGTRPLPEPLSSRTAGLPQAVTATTPQPDLAAAPAGYTRAPAPAAYADARPPAPAPPPGRREELPPPDPYAARPYPPDEGRLLRGRRLAILALCAVIGTGAGVATQQLTTHRTHAKPVARPTPTPAAPKPVTVTDVTSVDPKGTGFRKQDGGVWRSQHYASAKFGGLKDGIGLLVDLGTKRGLKSVTFDADGPLTVELRAGDDGSADPGAFQRVGSSVTANGKTSLPATAGSSHRYWLIWVTSLGPGNVAQIDSVGATG